MNANKDLQDMLTELQESMIAQIMMDGRAPQCPEQDGRLHGYRHILNIIWKEWDT